MIAFNLACYANVTGRMEEAKERLRHAIELDKTIRLLALDDEDLGPCGIGSAGWALVAEVGQSQGVCNCLPCIRSDANRLT